MGARVTALGLGAVLALLVLLAVACSSSPDEVAPSSEAAATSTTTTSVPAASGSVTVTDPTGDVVVEGRIGDWPDYDPRADLSGYTLSYSDTVTFILRAVEVDPSKLDDVWLSFDTDGEATGLPEIALAPLGGPYAVYEMRGQWTFVCPADRSIENGTYVVRFAATCVQNVPELQLRAPFLWHLNVGTTPTGSPNPCALPDPPATCPPYATYTDEIPGAATVERDPTRPAD